VVDEKAKKRKKRNYFFSDRKRKTNRTFEQETLLTLHNFSHLLILSLYLSLSLVLSLFLHFYIQVDLVICERYGLKKIGSHIANSHIKRSRVTVNQRIGSRKEAISGSHICEIADKKTAYNEGCLYCHYV